MKKVVIIHTSMVSYDVLNSLYKEIIPEAKVLNIVDEDLLDTLNRNRGITKSIIRRVCQYAVEAEANGADLLFSQCSSTSEGVDCARKMINIPFIKIDEAMVEKAVGIGVKIGIIATAAATLVPTESNIRTAAAQAGKEVKIARYLADGALDILMKEKNREKHDALVLDLIRKAEEENDVVVLAQGSMITILPYLKYTKVPVLTSPRLGVEKVRKELGLSFEEEKSRKSV